MTNIKLNLECTCTKVEFKDGKFRSFVTFLTPLQAGTTKIEEFQFTSTKLEIGKKYNFTLSDVPEPTDLPEPETRAFREEGE